MHLLYACFYRVTQSTVPFLCSLSQPMVDVRVTSYRFEPSWRIYMATFFTGAGCSKSGLVFTFKKQGNLSRLETIKARGFLYILVYLFQ